MIYKSDKVTLFFVAYFFHKTYTNMLTAGTRSHAARQ